MAQRRDPMKPRPPDSAESELETVEATEVSPALPSATLAAGAIHVTTGAPPGVRDGYHEIWSLSWPVMLAQVLANLVSLIDIAMVGRLGPEAVAAVGYATQFFFLAQSLLFAVGFSCVALMARAIGGGDADRARGALAASMLVSIAAAAAVMAIVLAAPATLLRLLGAEEAVVSLAIPYLQLMLASSVLLAVSMTAESGLRADRKTRLPMQIAAVVTSVKLLFNFLLIFGAMGLPRLELVGAGLATVISQLTAIAAFSWVMLRSAPGSPTALRLSDFGAARPHLREVIRISLPSIGERLAMNLALLGYFRILADFGTAAVAAYTVGIRVLSFSWIPGIGFGTAAATVVGQDLGAKRPEAARAAGWRATRAAVAVAVVLGLACAFASARLARLFTSDPATIAALGPFLLCLALSQPFLQAHFALAGAHRGAGDTFTPFIAATLGNWALRVPLAYLFAHVLRFELVWVWYVLMFDHMARAAWLTRSFRRGHWLRKLSDSG
jgi:putative MATE family efflux protein